MRQASFIKGYVKTLAEKRGDLSRGSIEHCHAYGLNSIVLREDPYIRLFVTDQDHDMHGRSHGWTVPTRIAFHSHHCDIRIECVEGRFYNTTWLKPEMSPGIKFQGFLFQSKINGGNGKFKTMGPTVYQERIVADQEMNPGAYVSMQAREIHSVWVPMGQRAAWLVTESAEDPSYLPVAWSTQDLTEFSPEGLYLPLSRKSADELVEFAIS